ncbi:MAG: ATP-dependent sacrificial sulfur transferase LarE [Anaerohalosphaeraceae bacterium]|nr:ATP-dependent sacrificial sulfur transferase LarE [Anaerohalosphaeraceae bacterium]
MTLDKKYKSLEKILHQLGKIVIAYSGGVDSTFLLKAAVNTIGNESVLAAIAAGPSLPRSQYEKAIEIAKDMGVKLTTIEPDEMADSSYTANKADRCFHCKSHLFKTLIDLAKEKNYDCVACGSNFDDLDDYRPGSKAAEILNIAAPLAEAELTKNDIRQLSRELNLPTADMSASPCLASRISYGSEITADKLKQVEMGEEFLKSLGLVEFRLRHHGQVGRIEVHKADIAKITAEPMREKIVAKLKSLGFDFVTVDLEGFRSGALNEVLSEEEKQDNL